MENSAAVPPSVQHILKCPAQGSPDGMRKQDKEVKRNHTQSESVAQRQKAGLEVPIKSSAPEQMNRWMDDRTVKTP